MPEDRPLEFTDEDMRRLEAELLARRDGPELIMTAPGHRSSHGPRTNRASSSVSSLKPCSWRIGNGTAVAPTKRVIDS